MIALAIVVAVLVLIAMLRVGVSVEYSVDGFCARARVGPASFGVYPRKEKPEKVSPAKSKTKKEKKKKVKKDKKKEKEKPEEKAPGKLEYLLVIIKSAGTALSRLRRRLLIKRLTLRLVAGSEDPSKTALMFGGAHAAYSTVGNFLRKHFRVRRSDLGASADFEASEPAVYAKAVISIAIWEVIYIAFALLPILTKKPKAPVSKQDRKEEKKNGEAPDQ